MREYDRLESHYDRIEKKAKAKRRQPAFNLSEVEVESFKKAHNFDCPTYSSNIPIETCLKRQEQAKAGLVVGSYGTKKNRSADFEHCNDCDLGAVICVCSETEMPVDLTQKVIKVTIAELGSTTYNPHYENKTIDYFSGILGNYN